MDTQSGFGGSTSFLDAEGNINSFNLNNNFSPRFIIGGTHFWGHADFYIAIPLYSQNMEIANQRIDFNRGVETAFKYYPFPIEHNKVRPFIGTSLAPFYFKQENNNLEFPVGPELNHTSFPLLTGLTYNNKNHLFELGITWNYANDQKYYISRTQTATINTPPIYANLSYKYMLETTLSAEKNWESGRTKEVTDYLAEQGELDGFYVGAGISSAFWLEASDYNKSLRPFIGRPGNSIMLDLTLGYYFHDPDFNIAVGYRGYGSTENIYGAAQQLNRKSVLLEATKYLFDYHGFVPFVGPAVSIEKLYFRESFEGTMTINQEMRKLGYGLTFGWDIRPNRIQSWILRTNLRWYPNLHLDLDSGSQISFKNIEFNFIQLIIYPDRLLN